MRALSLALVGAAAISVGLASAAHAMQPNESGWYCGGREDWKFASIEVAPDLTVNNFFFQETASMRTNMGVLKVSYSTLNRQSEPYNIGAQFAGFDAAGEIVFAIAAKPIMDQVQRGTETVDSDVYVTKSRLPQTERICATFAAQK